MSPPTWVTYHKSTQMWQCNSGWYLLYDATSHATSKKLTWIRLLNSHRNTMKWELLYLHSTKEEQKVQKGLVSPSSSCCHCQWKCFWIQETWLLARSLELQCFDCALTCRAHSLAFLFEFIIPWSSQEPGIIILGIINDSAFNVSLVSFQLPTS